MSTSHKDSLSTGDLASQRSSSSVPSVSQRNTVSSSSSTPSLTLWATLALSVLALTAVACITINVYFPEAAIKDLSEKIEDAVAREAGILEDSDSEAGAPDATSSEDDAASIDGQADTPESDRLASLWRAVAPVVGLVIDATAGDAQAQTVADPEITNPAIRRIISSRAQRVAELDRHKASGVLGENNKALVEVRSLDALELRDRAAVQKLVRDENADRDRMFREIAAATQADLSQLGRIQETYAQTLRANARPGDWIQLPNGQWTQK